MAYKLTKGEEMIGTADSLIDLYTNTQTSGAWQKVNPQAIKKPGNVSINFGDGDEIGLVPGYEVAWIEA